MKNLKTGNDVSGVSLLTLKQAAQRLAISKRTLERLIASGLFPAPLKIGRASRVTEIDVSSYLSQLLQERTRRAT